MATRQSSEGTEPAVLPGRIPAANDGDALDALSLLREDHEEVSDMLDEYEEAEADDRQDIAQSICEALTVHARIEEEIFYPAAREVLVEEDRELVNEADVEHATLKQLIERIQSLDGADDHFDAMVRVLGAYVKHHVGEEENELFPKLEDTELDLEALGQRLAQRRSELSSE